MPYSLSTGAVSALERGESLPAWKRAFPGFIQSDLTLNPGNSGGPLLDDRGVMLGLNTAIHESGIGMSFALPISRILPIVAQLKERGVFKKSYLGLNLVKMSYKRTHAAALPPRTGVRVRRVTPEGPGAISGLRSRDIILSMNGEPTNDHETLSWQLISTPAGQPVLLDVLRLPHPPQLLHLQITPVELKAPQE
jgi:S1-C subfamily serine protease